MRRIMTFLVGEALEKAIRKVTRGAEVRCAVAFWGHRAEKLFSDPRGARIICNLRAGGTNPGEIEKLKAAGAIVRQSDRLHAKVYVGRDWAIVTSANASANGLGLEGQEQASWIEAGVELKDPSAAAGWFEEQWKGSREIEDKDIREAKSRWKHRRRNRPSLNSFDDFETEVLELPLFSWWSKGPKWETLKDNVKDQIGYYTNELDRHIDNSMEIEHPEDEPILGQPGIWVLCWQRTSSGLPSQRGKPYWFYTDQVVRKAGFYVDDKSKLYDVVISVQEPPPEPFDATDRLFRQALREVVGRNEHKAFREGEYEGSWFASRQKLMRPLWRDLKERYRELATSAHSR